MACKTPQYECYMHCAYELQPVKRPTRIYIWMYRKWENATYPSGFNGINRRRINSNAQRNSTDRIVDWTQNEQLQSADAQLINLFVAFMSAINYLIKLNEMTWHEHGNLLAQTIKCGILNMHSRARIKLKTEVGSLNSCIVPHTTCSPFVSRNVKLSSIENRFWANLNWIFMQWSRRLDFFIHLSK